MVDSVVIGISYAILAALGLIVYIFLISSLLPHFTFRLSRVGKKNQDKGVRRIVFKDGRGIVYFPSVGDRSVLLQYALIQMSNEKYLKCRINETVSSIQYDVIVYNSKDKIIDVMGISEVISERGYTHAACLPLDTSYVELIPRRVNGKKYTSRKVSVGYNRIFLLVFLLSVTILTYAEMYFMELTLSNALNELNIILSRVPNRLICSLIIGVTYSSLVALYYNLKLNKVITK